LQNVLDLQKKLYAADSYRPIGWRKRPGSWETRGIPVRN